MLHYHHLQELIWKCESVFAGCSFTQMFAFIIKSSSKLWGECEACCIRYLMGGSIWGNLNIYLINSIKLKSWSIVSRCNTLWKVSISKFFWSMVSPIRTEYGPEKRRIRTLFTNCKVDIWCTWGTFISTFFLFHYSADKLCIRATLYSIKRLAGSSTKKAGNKR